MEAAFQYQQIYLETVLVVRLLRNDDTKSMRLEMMTRKVCALAEITIGQVPPVLTPISATPHFKDFVLLNQSQGEMHRRWETSDEDESFSRYG